MQLDGKVAVVTGGASGIGQACSRLMATRGATVMIGDIATQAASKTAADIAGAGGRAWAHHLDVTDATSVEVFVQEILERYGRIDVLVNNAGAIISPTSVVDCSEVAWDRTCTLIMKGAFLMSRAVVPVMVRQGAGAIIHMGSVAALTGRRNNAAYSAAKGALLSLTRAMAADHGPQGIRVNCVCPGPTLTPAFLQDLERAPDPAAQRARRAAESFLGRLGEPEDIAQAVAFLVSDQAAWITGSIFPVDGGNTAA